MTKSSISNIVMRRVRIIHGIRAAAAPVAACSAFLFALWGIGREVWVAKVFENMPVLTDTPAVFDFYLSAFLATDLVVQIFCILAVASLVWLASELAHTVRPYTRSRFA